MMSNASLLLAGVPENYRLGGSAAAPGASARGRARGSRSVGVCLAVAQADAVIGTRPFLKLSAKVAKPGTRLRWVQTTTVGMDHVVPPALLAAEHLTLTRIKGPPRPLIVRRFAENQPLLGVVDRRAGY